MLKRRGWIMTKEGKRHVVPDFLLDEEAITWPPTLTETQPGQRTPMLTPSDFYRRHEIVPGQAYFYLPDSSRIEDVPEDVINDLLGGED